MFLGLVIGVVAAGGAEFLDDRIYDEEDFKKLVAAEVMAEIPPLPTMQEQEGQKRKIWMAWSGAAAMTVIILAGTAISFLRG